MFRNRLVLVASLLCLNIGRPAQAQLTPGSCIPPCVPLVASVPHGVDIVPPDYVFNVDGQITASIAGSALMGSGITLGTGSAHLLFRQLIMRSTYTEGFGISTSTTGAGFASSTPWSAPTMATGSNEPMPLTFQAGSMAIGELVPGGPGSTNRYTIAQLRIDPAYAGDLVIFSRSTFTIQAFVQPQATVPEPGTLALFGSLIAAGFLGYRRRRW